MGIFDKKQPRKKGDDFDSPVERIDLSSPSPVAAAPEAEQSDEVVDQAPAGSAPEPAPAAKPSSSYGIEQAIALMRTLPQESVELVVSVVKHTLESTNIDLPTIIDDATRKQERIDARIKVLKAEIEDLEAEIKTRTKEIGELEDDHKETSMVKERLELAVKLDKAPSGVAAPAPRTGRSTKASVPPPMPSKSSSPSTSTSSSAASSTTSEKSTHTIVSKK